MLLFCLLQESGAAKCPITSCESTKWSISKVPRLVLNCAAKNLFRKGLFSELKGKKDISSSLLGQMKDWNIVKAFHLNFIFQSTLHILPDSHVYDVFVHIYNFQTLYLLRILFPFFNNSLNINFHAFLCKHTFAPKKMLMSKPYRKIDFSHFFSWIDCSTLLYSSSRFSHIFAIRYFTGKPHILR